MINPAELPFRRRDPSTQPGPVQQWATAKAQQCSTGGPGDSGSRGTGLPLTTLEGGVSFAMLPKAEAIPAWLSPEANRGDQRSAGLLVLNDPGSSRER